MGDIEEDHDWFDLIMEEFDYSLTKCEEAIQRIGAFGSDIKELWSRFRQPMVDVDMNFIVGEEHFYDVMVIPFAEVNKRAGDTYGSDDEEEEEDSDNHEGEEVEEERPHEHWAMSVAKIPNSLNQEQEDDDGFDGEDTASTYELAEEDEDGEEVVMFIGNDDDDDGGDDDDLLEKLDGFVDVMEEDISMAFIECDWVYVQRIN